ncbi:MAG: ribosome small subunit-dependent GTPase A, partial [Woeseiaceae bacterium]
SMQAQTALVVATFSRRMQLRLPQGDEVIARIKGKRLKPVCGDRVFAEPIDKETDWLITSIADRDNELRRPNARGAVEVLAANVELLVAMTAGSPRPDWFIVDKYLCAAELMGAAGAVVFNKIDLEPPDAAADAALRDYAETGYATVRCSARSGERVDELAAILHARTAIIVGQSGVGKSSLINRLIGAERLRTASISGKSGEGRHTTVNSAMLQLPDGGAVIDSPGVRDYAPALQSPAEVSIGYREIHAAGHHCRFSDCRHDREPGCAVHEGVADGTISARRFESYRRLVTFTEQLAGKYR